MGQAHVGELTFAAREYQLKSNGEHQARNFQKNLSILSSARYKIQGWHPAALVDFQLTPTVRSQIFKALTFQALTIVLCYPQGRALTADNFGTCVPSCWSVPVRPI